MTWRPACGLIRFWYTMSRAIQPREWGSEHWAHTIHSMLLAAEDTGVLNQTFTPCLGMNPQVLASRSAGWNGDPGKTPQCTKAPPSLLTELIGFDVRERGLEGGVPTPFFCRNGITGSLPWLISSHLQCSSDAAQFHQLDLSSTASVESGDSVLSAEDSTLGGQSNVGQLEALGTNRSALQSGPV